MDANYKKIMHIKAKNALAALEKNHFKAAYVNTKEEALTLIKTLIPEGAYTAMGGSMTLEETGIASYLRESTDFHKAYEDAYQAEYYLLSANAVTENGEIYQVDARGNRVSAMIYGPKKVILVVGINKLVPTLRDAVVRVKEVAAPINATRLCRDTPCTKLGHCISPSFDADNFFTGCMSDECICRKAVTLRQQMKDDRFTVILVGEELGY